MVQAWFHSGTKMNSIRVVLKYLVAASCGACSAILSGVLMFFLVFNLFFLPLISLDLGDGGIVFAYRGFGSELNLLAFLVMDLAAGIMGFFGIKQNPRQPASPRRSSLTAVANGLATLGWVGFVGAVLSLTCVVFLVGYCI